MKASTGSPLDSFSNAMTPKFLAEKFIKVVDARITGVIHIAGERLSRYEFATILAEILGVSKDLVKPKKLAEAKLVAPRPRDSSLDTSKAKELGLALPSTRECLKDMVETYRRITRGEN